MKIFTKKELITNYHRQAQDRIGQYWAKVQMGSPVSVCVH